MSAMCGTCGHERWTYHAQWAIGNGGHPRPSGMRDGACSMLGCECPDYTEDTLRARPRAYVVRRANPCDSVNTRVRVDRSGYDVVLAITGPADSTERYTILKVDEAQDLAMLLLAKARGLSVS